MKKFLCLCVASAMLASLSGCVITVEEVFGEEDAKVSNLELQQMQTREFDATVEQAFSAVISTFQSYGYLIQSADKSTGMVLAKTNSQADIDNFKGFVKTQYDKATAFIEQISQNRVRIRVSIVKYVTASSMGYSGEKEAPRTNAKVYQDIFAKIQESLFLKRNL